MNDTKYTPDPLTAKALISSFRRHEEWAKRSGFASLSWSEFKASRNANPLARSAIIAKATGERK